VRNTFAPLPATAHIADAAPRPLLPHLTTSGQAGPRPRWPGTLVGEGGVR
jgi:hypothetical protein